MGEGGTRVLVTTAEGELVGVVGRDAVERVREQGPPR
jgi:hypothetical protein